MGRRRWTRLAFVVVSISLMSREPAAQPPPGARWFPDRPVAWNEHDDADIPAPPKANHIQEYDTALLVRDSMANEVDRYLAVEGRRPARDVNALDEVPCSTWFCARNHLHPMTPAEVAAGPPAHAPILPLTIVKGKDEGAAAGFQVKDAAGRKFLLKLDPARNPGLATTGEMVGSRLFHAAGYDVPQSYLLHVARADLLLDPKATYHLYGVQVRPLRPERVDDLLTRTARDPDGRYRAVAVQWIEGTFLGAYDLLGTRKDDPNDRLPHEDRRSLRANRVLFSWLSVFDASAINTLDTMVIEDGRKFVRHHIIDFGCAFGSATGHPQAPREDAERTLEFGRTLRAIFSLGFYQRRFQKQRQDWALMTNRFPSLGYYPAEGFDPDEFRSNRKLPTHIRMTDRDAYWGAKVATSFTDAQLEAAVKTAELPQDAAAYLLHALEVRRDIIGRRYLRPVTSVEGPTVSADGGNVCFQDIALARGYSEPAETHYLVEVRDGHGQKLTASIVAPVNGGACVPIGGAGRGTGYRVLRVATSLGGPDVASPEVAKPARIHLRWRDAERRFAVVGLERDE
jgi:hypothetical protein